MTMTGAGGAAGSQGQGQPAQQWNLYIDVNIFKYPHKLLFCMISMTQILYSSKSIYIIRVSD